MSRFSNSRLQTLTPYTPGEQPQKQKYVKLNTNESPFPPSEKALAYAAENTRSLNLYSDPDCVELTRRLAETYGVSSDMVLVTNGSDEILNFAFMAFCDADRPAVFPSVTYGFYPVFASLNGIPYEEIPLLPDFSVDAEAFMGINKTVFIANPNAPTGMELPIETVEKIVASNPNSIVLIDEAYVDFGGTSCVGLTKKYDNLLVTQTFSKSRSLAGGRLGYGIGHPDLIRDLNTIKYSTNPYNINSMTMAVGIGVLNDPDYMQKNCAAIIGNRAYTVDTLRNMGFAVLDSKANFVFARSDRIEGGALYRALKERGVLVRHFDKAGISDYNRITIGTREQMDILLRTIESILEEQQ